VTGTFVLSVNTEDTFEPHSGRPNRDASDKRHQPQRDAARRFMRLLTGHAMAATWIVGESALLAAWGRRRTDGRETGNKLVAAISSLAEPQDIALLPSCAAASAPERSQPDKNDGILRCSQFPEWKRNRICTLALPADTHIEAAPYASFGFTTCCGIPPTTRPSSLTDDLFQRPLPMWQTSALQLDGSVLMLPVSMGLANADNHRRLVPEAVRVARVRKGLDQASREGAIVHLALRLSELGRSEHLFRTVEDILFDVAEARGRGALRMVTVAALRRLYDDRANAAAPRKAA
jgi:hypothetical protein